MRLDCWHDRERPAAEVTDTAAPARKRFRRLLSRQLAVSQGYTLQTFGNQIRGAWLWNHESRGGLHVGTEYTTPGCRAAAEARCLSEPAIIYSVFCVMPLARAMSELAAVQGVGFKSADASAGRVVDSSPHTCKDRGNVGVLGDLRSPVLHELRSHIRNSDVP